MPIMRNRNRYIIIRLLEVHAFFERDVERRSHSCLTGWKTNVIHSHPLFHTHTQTHLHNCRVIGCKELSYLPREAALRAVQISHCNVSQIPILLPFILQKEAHRTHPVRNGTKGLTTFLLKSASASNDERFLSNNLIPV